MRRQKPNRLQRRPNPKSRSSVRGNLCRSRVRKLKTGQTRATMSARDERRRQGLSAEDRALWTHVTNKIAPLRDKPVTAGEAKHDPAPPPQEIGRASCRERV